VLAFLKENIKTEDGHLHVGVLNFCVQLGNKPAYNAGPLNRRLANRLELALLLALDPATNNDRVRILQYASDAVVEQSILKANHLTVVGRQAFFNRDYTPWWGSESEGLQPHAFVTGVARIDLEKERVTVTIQAFDSEGEKLLTAHTFDVPLDPRTLSEAGVSLVARGQKFKDKEIKPTSSTPPEIKPKAGSLLRGFDTLNAVAKLRTTLGDSPVKLKLLYDGKEQELDYDGRYPEPKEGQKVQFLLSNDSDLDFGVVLRVNGRNTLYPDRDNPDDRLAPMWIVRKKETLPINGFYYRVGDPKAFEVATKEQSQNASRKYGPKPGTFSFAVFAAKKDVREDATSGAPTEKVRSSSGDTLLVSLGLPAKVKKPIKLKDLQANLRKPNGAENAGNGLQARGLIGEGGKLNEVVEEKEFDRADRSLIALSLRYYDVVNTEE
jgi:hypothetical protein